ncbi:hypothetical protein LTS08_004010 [Lithohypha guttulata]|nr:hypothetical protein LTS08_004010 [Lithohypha guttulata]
MAEVIGAVSGLAALIGIACKGIQSLIKCLKEIHNAPDVVLELIAQLEAILVVLQSLEKTIDGDDDALKTLKGPIEWCGTACIQLRTRLIGLGSNQSHASRLVDWTKLKFMGNDIEDFKKAMASYKSTICIAVGDVNLRELKVSQKVLSEYRDLIGQTQKSLEQRLDQFHDRLKSVYTSTEPTSESEQRTAIAEAEHTKRCIQICEEAAENIAKLQFESDAVAPRHEDLPEQDTRSRAFTIADLMTKHSFERTKHDFLTTATQLKQTLEVNPGKRSGMCNNVGERASIGSDERRLLQATIDNLDAQIGYLNEARVRESSYRTNRWRDIEIAEDSRNALVSTIGDLLDINQLRIGPRSVSLMGQTSDESFQVFCRGMVPRQIEVKQEGAELPPSFATRWGGGKSLGGP